MDKIEEITKRLKQLPLADFVARGIVDAGGSEEDVRLLALDDFIDMGREIVQRCVDAANMERMKVLPRPQTITLLLDHEGVIIHNKKVREWLISVCQQEYPEKEVVLVAVKQELIEGGDEEKYVQRFGFTLLENAIPYLIEVAYHLLRHDILARYAGEDGVEVIAINTCPNPSEKDVHLRFHKPYFFDTSLDGEQIEGAFWELDTHLPKFFLGEKV